MNLLMEKHLEAKSIKGCARLRKIMHLAYFCTLKIRKSLEAS